MLRLIPWNTDRGGAAKTVLSGYYRFGWETIIGGTYGMKITAILEVYED